MLKVGLSPVSEALVDAVAARAGWVVDRAERVGPGVFDVRMEGRYAESGGYAFSALLKLAAIRHLTGWYSKEVAAMSDYPNMVRAGDWSGIRDSSAAVIDAIFDRFVLGNK